MDRLDQQGRLDWDEVFVDESFTPAKIRGFDVGKTKRGKGTNWVVADGQGIPLACSTADASPAEVKLVEGMLIKVPHLEDRCIALIADRAYDSEIRFVNGSSNRNGI